METTFGEIEIGQDFVLFTDWQAVYPPTYVKKTATTAQHGERLITVGENVAIMIVAKAA